MNYRGQSDGSPLGATFRANSIIDTSRAPVPLAIDKGRRERRARHRESGESRARGRRANRSDYPRRNRPVCRARRRACDRSSMPRRQPSVLLFGRRRWRVERAVDVLRAARRSVRFARVGLSNRWREFDRFIRTVHLHLDISFNRSRWVAASRCLEIKVTWPARRLATRLFVSRATAPLHAPSRVIDLFHLNH